MQKFKDQIARIEWYRAAINFMLTLSAVVGGIFGGVFFVLDDRYAPREETTTAIGALVSNQKVQAAEMINHDAAPYVHMTIAEKRSTFVTRVEWTGGRNQTTREFGEVKDLLKEMRQEQNGLLMQILQSKK
jgi:hypothetical protein